MPRGRSTEEERRHRNDPFVDHRGIEYEMVPLESPRPRRAVGRRITVDADPVLARTGSNPAASQRRTSNLEDAWLLVFDD